MNINELTLGQAKELAALFGNANSQASIIGSQYIGQKVIVRTYSAGVWFGELSEKSGDEVILKNARRMWRWQAKESISLSGVAVHGINQEYSKIAPAVASVWLEAIEILSLADVAISSIEEALDVKADC